jgi:Sortase domain
VTDRYLLPKPPNGRRWSIRLAAPVAFLLIALSACGSGSPADPSPRQRLPREAVTGDSHAAPIARRKVARPRWIKIPAIGVSAPVIPLGLNRDRTLEVPRDYGKTGWYRAGPKPGELGPAVIVGHVDSKTGPAVFYRLRELKRGDKIVIRGAHGRTVRFRINGLERWPKAAFPTRRVYGRTRGSVLRLVTCSGAFNASSGHYVDNTIVFASLQRR